MANIKIVYIATGKHYISLFDKWIRNIEFFAQEDVKNVVLLTNEDIDISIYNLDKVNITKHHIMHLPWPLTALLKFHFIYNHIDENDDFVFYFNANYLPYQSLNIERLNEDALYVFRSNKKCRNYKWQETNPYNEELKYVVSTVVGGSYKQMKECCEFIIAHVSKMLMKNEIEYKHDESALNHYVVHLEKNHKPYIIMDFEDFGELDYEAHNNGDIPLHNNEVEKCVLE